jgi:hypothetical protein
MELVKHGDRYEIGDYGFKVQIIGKVPKCTPYLRIERYGEYAYFNDNKRTLLAFARAIFRAYGKRVK